MSSLQSPVRSPAELILARVEAFRRGDFGAVYDSYHQDANFRRQFPDREAYVRYGWAHLGKEFRIRRCTILREETNGAEARVISWLEFELHGVPHAVAELAWLQRNADEWRYRCGQKLTADELPVPLAQLDFAHFDDLAEKVIY